MVRPRSLSLVARMLTIRLEYVRPSLIITAVENAVRISFWAVPAFILVDPAMASGPVSTVISTSTGAVLGASGLPDTSAVRAPSSCAAVSAPITNGVRPDAARPSTKSPGRASRESSAAPAAESSSAPSTASTSARRPPAWWATNQPGGMLNVGGSSAASTVASRPDVPAPT